MDRGEPVEDGGFHGEALVAVAVVGAEVGGGDLRVFIVFYGGDEALGLRHETVIGAYDQQRTGAKEVGVADEVPVLVVAVVEHFFG